MTGRLGLQAKVCPLDVALVGSDRLAHEKVNHDNASSFQSQIVAAGDSQP